MKVHEIVKDVIETNDREIFRLANKCAEMHERIRELEKAISSHETERLRSKKYDRADQELWLKINTIEVDE